MKLRWALAVCLFIFVLGNYANAMELSKLTVKEAGYVLPPAGPIMRNCVSNYAEMARYVYLWDVATPWDISGSRYTGKGHSLWVTPYDKIVQAVARNITLIPGDGFYCNGWRLEFTHINESDYWGKARYVPPCFTLWWGKGDCPDCPTALCSLFIAKRYQAMVVVGYNETYKIAHLWVEYKDRDGKMYSTGTDHDLPTTPLYYSCLLVEKNRNIPICFVKQHMFNNTIDWTPYHPW